MYGVLTLQICILTGTLGNKRSLANKINKIKSTNFWKIRKAFLEVRFLMPTFTPICLFLLGIGVPSTLVLNVKVRIFKIKFIFKNFP